MKLNRGDVVVTRFPHAGGLRGKKRPALADAGGSGVPWRIAHNQAKSDQARFEVILQEDATRRSRNSGAGVRDGKTSGRQRPRRKTDQASFCLDLAVTHNGPRSTRCAWYDRPARGHIRDSRVCLERRMPLPGRWMMKSLEFLRCLQICKHRARMLVKRRSRFVHRERKTGIGPQGTTLMLRRGAAAIGGSRWWGGG